MQDDSPVLCQALDRAQVDMTCVGVILWAKGSGLANYGGGSRGVPEEGTQYQMEETKGLGFRGVKL